MMFSCSIGSKGQEENKTFSIYMPMVLSGGNDINLDENAFEGTLNGYKCVLEKHHYIYSLKVEGFNSEIECDDFIEKLKAAIFWFSLKRTVGVKIPDTINEVKLYETRIIISEESSLKSVTDRVGWSVVDGDYNADQLVIIQENKKLTRWETGKVNALLSYNPSSVLDDINEGFCFENIEELIFNKKLRLAVELFSAFKFEITTTGKFVKLVTVLEALLPDSQIGDESIQALRLAKKSVKDYRNKLKKSGEDVQEIELLLSRIGNLKSKSIGASLREYLLSLLEKYPHLGKSDVVIPKVNEIYSARSILLHTGEQDEKLLENYVSVLAELVPEILKANFIFEG